MPEGPSILIAKEAMRPFVGERVIAASGNAKIEMSRINDQTIRDIKTWGKQLLICFDHFSLRIHFLMFGTFLINERKEKSLRLSLECRKGELNFYTCSVRLISEPLKDLYDFSADVLNEHWNARKAGQKLKEDPSRNVCDILLDQQIFSGVGNIIKNEVLFRIRVHPKSIIGKLPPKQKSALVREARKYSFDFLKWKRDFVLKKHWLIYTRKTCPRDHVPVKREYLGKGKRRTFFCDKCQVLYS